MAWLDDRIYAHPKIRNVPRATRWSYAAALAYSSGFGTKGVLTDGQLKAIECTKRDRELLIKVGLWEDAGRGAIRIHDWKDHNGKRDQRREADRLRKRAARAKDAETSAGHNADKPQTDDAVSAGQTVDRPRAPARRRPPDDGSDRVTYEGLDTNGAGNRSSETRAAEAPEPPLASPTPPAQNELDAAAADELEKHLDDLAIPGSLRDTARTEPRRALAVARYTIANHAGGAYFRTVFESGDWPANPDSNGKPTKSAYQRAETLIRNVGKTLDDHELDRELDDLHITDDQRTRLRKLHDQVRAST